MNESRKGILIVALVYLLLELNPVAAQDPSAQVRVMTFNIRYGTAKDGVNDWDRRKEFLVETITKFNPDLLGTQETLGFQRDYLAQRLSAYDPLGVGRDDGKEKWEMMALYYKRERFTKVDEGHFWLSETPEVSGSKSWDSSLPRMVTWVKLRDEKHAAAVPFVFFNTHFDHRGPQARLKSAELLRKRIDEVVGTCPVIVTGDFNSGEGTEPYKALFGTADDSISAVVDCFRVMHPQRTEKEGTATAFKANSVSGARIDWIASSQHFEVVSVEIDRTERDGRTTSDHFPVEAVLRRK